MFIFASLLTDPTTIASWIVVGLFSGWFMGKLTDEPSYGTLGDLVLGVCGAMAGGLAFTFIKDGASFWGALIVAIVSAWVIILAGRTVVARRSE